MKAAQLLCLPDDCQTWTVPTLLKQMIRLPAMLARHTRRLVARVEATPSWLNWWHQWQVRWWPGAAASG